MAWSHYLGLLVRRSCLVEGVVVEEGRAVKLLTMQACRKPHSIDCEDISSLFQPKLVVSFDYVMAISKGHQHLSDIASTSR